MEPVQPTFIATQPNTSPVASSPAPRIAAVAGADSREPATPLSRCFAIRARAAGGSSPNLIVLTAPPAAGCISATVDHRRRPGPTAPTPHAGSVQVRGSGVPPRIRRNSATPRARASSRGVSQGISGSASGQPRVREPSAVPERSNSVSVSPRTRKEAARAIAVIAVALRRDRAVHDRAAADRRHRAGDEQPTPRQHPVDARAAHRAGGAGGGRAPGAGREGDRVRTSPPTVQRPSSAVAGASTTPRARLRGGEQGRSRSSDRRCRPGSAARSRRRTRRGGSSRRRCAAPGSWTSASGADRPVQRGGAAADEHLVALRGPGVARGAVARPRP